MYIAFLHGIQKEDQEGIPAEKFNFWINKAQEDWQTERSRLFDTEQKRIDDLYLLRTERVIPTNGSRTVISNASLRLLSNGSGTFVVTPESYFSVSGLVFLGKTLATANTGSIDPVTGIVADAIVGDVFYALVWYSELDQPIVTMIVVGLDNEGVVVPLIGTHEPIENTITSGTYHLPDTTAYQLFLTNVETDREGILTDYGIVWPEGATPMPIIINVDYKFLIPNGYPNPKYLRLLSLQFKVDYKDNAIFPDGYSEWLKAIIMRGDQRAEIYENAFRYPTDEKPYYRLLGEFVEFINETDSLPYKMKIEYLKYANDILYVAPNSSQVAIDSVFMPIQQKEIVDMAVRMYIEAIQSPRYQTQVVEEQIKDKFE